MVALALTTLIDSALSEEIATSKATNCKMTEQSAMIETETQRD